MNNKYTFTLPKGDDKYINLPVEIKWDFIGRDDAVDEYQENVVDEIIGKAEDFEVSRFGHAFYDNNTKTDIKYEFNFFSVDGGLVPPNPSSDVLTATASDWVTSYIPEGFLSTEIYYYDKPFTKSFFKLDFYDSTETVTQTNYFTVIIPVQQGLTDTTSISALLPNVDIKIPSFKLDYIGDKEGFFLYWLRKKDFLNINPSGNTETFYMAAKFFDARLGIFIKMTNTAQPDISSLFNFDPKKYFYYRVVLDYDDNTYKIFDNNTNSRVGTTSSIKWYEYINP